MTQLSEDDLIARLFAPMAGPGGLGLLDDAALIRPEPGSEVVATVDALVAGVHFFADDSPASIAAKALGVNLSDLAAKGAEPVGFVLSLALPSDWTTPWLEAFAQGLAAASTASGCPLLGGDTVKTPGPLTLSVTALGRVPSGAMVRRTGARPGDRLYVSGTIGDAALGLEARKAQCGDVRDVSSDAAFLIDRYLHPRPRLALIPALRRHATGAMDVSDGFLGDTQKFLKASGATGTVQLGEVPLSEAVRSVLRRRPEALATALGGGDDYEILASVPAARAAAFEAEAYDCGVDVTAFGDVREGQGPPTFLDREGRAVSFAHLSFSHF